MISIIFNINKSDILNLFHHLDLYPGFKYRLRISETENEGVTGILEVFYKNFWNLVSPKNFKFIEMKVKNHNKKI